MRGNVRPPRGEIVWVTNLNDAIDSIGEAKTKIETAIR